jgi:chromosome segregation ATPase
MASLMKSLALAAGAGVAIGICTTASSRRALGRDHVTRNGSSRRNEVSSDSLIDIEPLLSRLEEMERRFEAVASVKPVVNVIELTQRMDAQDAEIERLRGLVDVQANAIQTELEAEMDERHRRSYAALEQTLETAISDRIAAVERKLTDHSTSIEELRDRAQDTDANLKRLIVAIEKLVERGQAIPQPVAHATPSTGAEVLSPFEAHLNEARRKEEAAKTDASRLYKEEEPKKPRFPMARIFGMIALVVMAGGFNRILG